MQQVLITVIMVASILLGIVLGALACNEWGPAIDSQAYRELTNCERSNHEPTTNTH